MKQTRSGVCWWVWLVLIAGIIGALSLDNPRVGRVISAMIAAWKDSRVSVPYVEVTGSPSPGDGRSRPGQGLAPVLHAPCDPGLDAWAVYPTRTVGTQLCDDVSWQLMSRPLALGLSYGIGKPCIDPVLVGAVCNPAPVVSVTGASPAAPDLAELARATGAKHLLVPGFQSSDASGGRFRIHVRHERSGFMPELLLELPYRNGPDGDVDQVLLDAVQGALVKLGLKPVPSGAGTARSRSLVTPPAPPEALFGRLQARAAKAGATVPWVGRAPTAAELEEWFGASHDRLVLGNYLAAGTFTGALPGSDASAPRVDLASRARPLAAADPPSHPMCGQPPDTTSRR